MLPTPNFRLPTDLRTQTFFLLNFALTPEPIRCSLVANRTQRNQSLRPCPAHAPRSLTCMLMHVTSRVAQPRLGRPHGKAATQVAPARCRGAVFRTRSPCHPVAPCNCSVAHAAAARFSRSAASASGFADSGGLHLAMRCRCSSAASPRVRL
jgi:hypothetical protein